MKAKSRALFKKETFTTKDAEKAGVSRNRLSQYVQTGKLERISRGIYRNPSVPSSSPIEWEDLIVTVQSIPNATICLISALAIYRMTEEVSREHWIAIPNNQWAARRPNTKILRYRNTAVGQTTVKVGSHRIPIFDRERTVIDSFRHLPMETAIKVLRTYLQGEGANRPDFRKLNQYSRKLRIPIDSYVLALTA